MYNKEQSQDFINKFAEMIQIFSGFNLSCSEVEALNEYEEIFEEIRHILDICYIENGYAAYAKKIDEIVSTETEQTKYRIKVYAICINMDSKISYSPTEEPGFMSMYPLMPDRGQKYVKIQSLNTNYDKTSIWINPLFDIPLYCIGDYEKPLANRNSFEGLNAKLQHSSYVSWTSPFEI